MRVILRPLIICMIGMTLSCSEKEGSDEQKKGEEEGKYSLIRDNLYRDASGNLYLKSINKEDLEHGTKHDVWLTEVYCDTCWTATEQGWKDITVLRDFVDTASFHLDRSNQSEGGDFYRDKNHRYYHKWMADGGTITLIGNSEGK
ncbi:MAG: hypothetical protein EP338_09375 [Bacteroidetes bacterium]|nr:MAG: hypothetical protein EP338_09375 [Bacteroidota bacterium]